MKFHPSLQELLTSAKRRTFSHLLLRELLVATAVALGIAAIVLLAGSARLAWYWIPLAAIATLIIRLILENRKRPSPYVLAQRIDDRLKLADTLSTAAYFSDSEASRRVDPALRDLQRTRAEEVARTVDVKQALPLRRPSALYPAAILALFVAGVFLLRVAATGSYDTRASLVEGPLQALLQPAEKQARAEKKPGAGEEPGSGDQTSKELDKNRDYAGEPEPQKEAEAETPETPEAQKAEQSQKGEGKGEPSAAESQTPQNPPNLENASEQGKQQDGQQQESLLDKLKDAVSDMMNKVKPSSGKQQKSSQKGKKSERQQGDDQQKSSDMDDKNPGDNADSENHNKGNEMDASGMSAEGEKDDNEHSGVGSQEGDKSARQAEALKAMGKITELFGKRAENVTGAVMIEVGSTRQQLKTPLAQRDASHAEAGSEIHRDEVPLEYEQFVQRYFDQVRRTPAGPSSGK
jgi:hypothetical protein